MKYQVVMGAPADRPASFRIPGSREYPCAKCGTATTVSPLSFPHVEAGAKVVCSWCGPDALGPGKPVVTEECVQEYNLAKGTNYTREQIELAMETWVRLKRKQS